MDLLNSLNTQTVECVIYLDQLNQDPNINYLYRCDLSLSPNIYFENPDIEFVDHTQEEIREQVLDNHIISFIKSDEYIRRYILLIMSDSLKEYNNCQSFNNDLKLYENDQSTAQLNINSIINENLNTNINFYLQQVNPNTKRLLIHLDYNTFMYYAKENEIITNNIVNLDVVKEFIKKILENQTQFSYNINDPNDIYVIKKLFDIEV